jgi:hypothetical protein
MNNTKVPMPYPSDQHASGLSHHIIANITIGAINTAIAAAQLILGYLTYRASRSKMHRYADLHVYESVD